MAWVLAAILTRSLTSIDFDRRVAQWGFPALAEWSPAKSPTLLAARSIAWTVMLIGFLIGISAFDVALTSQFVIRLFAYLPNVLAAVVVLAAGSIVARFLARSVLIGAVNMNLQYARLLTGPHAGDLLQRIRPAAADIRRVFQAHQPRTREMLIAGPDFAAKLGHIDHSPFARDRSRGNATECGRSTASKLTMCPVSWHSNSSPSRQWTRTAI